MLSLEHSHTLGKLGSGVIARRYLSSIHDRYRWCAAAIHLHERSGKDGLAQHCFGIASLATLGCHGLSRGEIAVSLSYGLAMTLLRY